MGSAPEKDPPMITKKTLIYSSPIHEPFAWKNKMASAPKKDSPMIIQKNHLPTVLA
jgi:hypothetical protein